MPGFPGGAFQWFGLSAMDPARLAAGVQAARPALDGFIDAELARHGLPASACALVGFSQGTMMALHVGPRRREALGAVVGFSGLLAGPERLGAEIASRPPILLAHGDRDDRVPPQAMFEALSALGDAGAPALWRLCLGQGHTIPEEALALGRGVPARRLCGRARRLDQAATPMTTSFAASGSRPETAPVLVVGAGRMGGAMARGWLRSGALTPAELTFRDPNPGQDARNAIEQGAGHDLEDLAAYPTVMLAVKPQVWRVVAQTLAPRLAPDAVVVSVVAGVRLADLTQAFDGRRAVRGDAHHGRGVRPGDGHPVRGR